jgi:quinone-modifying oxidoreductase subunit QmoC
MIRDRFRDREQVAGTYFDWSLILLLLFVVLTGFATEAMHFARMEPHRHTIYFFHLVLIFALLIYLPYSKLAHIVYRTAAMVFAEHTGRESLDGTTEAGERSESGERALAGSAGEGGRWAP